MQIVEIESTDGFPYYCPITGVQILSEGEALKGESHLDYEEYHEILFSLKDNDVAKNWICFRLFSGTNFSGYVVDHCIDMGYRP